MTKGALLANKAPSLTEELCQHETKGKGKTMKANVILHLFQGYAFCSSNLGCGMFFESSIPPVPLHNRECQELSLWPFLGCALSH